MTPGQKPEAVREPAARAGAELERIVLRGWTVEDRSIWTYVRPAVPSRRVQGWKLHVSATILSAPDVLAACLPVLVETGTPFKFASTSANLKHLNEFRTPRGGSGKFITAYPDDDGRFRVLAEDLHAATEGLAGPAILSDAPYRKGSLVHYRYGAFQGVQVLSNDGAYVSCILDPDGNPVVDERPAVFSPPSWAAPPFADTVHRSADGAPKAVLLRDRYEITTAIRHANKGGVYRAADRRTGREVIVKEARPHVATDVDGRDARDLLRHEAEVLRRGAPLGVMPAFVDEFEQDGHRFLVEEAVRGRTLRQKIALAAGEGLLWPPVDALPAIVHRLAGMLRALHGHGMVVRDLSPQNVMVTDDGELRLVDLEMVAVRDGSGWDVMHRAGGTPGFSAPEQFAGAEPDPSADLYGVGATAYYLLTRADPALADDRPAHCPLEERVARMIAPPLVPADVPPVVRTLITGTLRSDPAERTPLEEVLRLTADGAAGPVPVRPVRPSVPAEEETATFGGDRWSVLVGDILGHLAATLPDDSEARPWPETVFGRDKDLCTVQHGLAGMLAVLARLVEDGESPGGHVPVLLDAVLPRLLRQQGRVVHRLPGLYFGFAGTAWALFDAGRALGRTDLTARAVEFAASLPTAWPNPDVTHGIAGLGTCLLHLWEGTGDPALLERADACADQIMAAADTGGGAIHWTVPPSFDSKLAGYRSYGFAHGVAGIGAYLLAAGRALDRPDLLAAAERCGDVLLEAAIHADGAAFWPERPGSDSRAIHWCNGSSGVGTFLCRLHAHGGDPRHRDAAVAAGRAVLRTRRLSGTAYCHGLAGNGDLLVELAETTGDRTYLAWAETLADLLAARALDRDGRLVPPDESGKEVTAGYGAGLAGHLSFLLRLRSGGPRLFHPLLAGPYRPSAGPARPMSASFERR
ncbi:class IV lanthionine synthetase LanL [Actinomadura fibrosa]|uniref:non-specific serine/threonine protein kinase n=1 Tax=Actinomadura fibrosa TaxID=111802 RepID=A0ABW2XYI1_9ACTN|nr:class IV lanthionine synthetase LanL [Actinomadura fibrosa]